MSESKTDEYGNELQTFTKTSQCALVGTTAPQCPAGWESVGYTQPGSCTIGNAPGDGPRDTWQMQGYQRVCKRRVPTSGDLGIDCCSNLFGISDSLECANGGFKPYSWKCNNIMQETCNTVVQKDPYGPEWNGMPGGQDNPMYRPCTNSVAVAGPERKPGCSNEFCVNYLRNAPPGNFFKTHDYEDYPYHFPRHSYTTPGFDGTWGYTPERTPYKPYHEYEHKNASSYCQRNPHECRREWINDYHY